MNTTRAAIAHIICPLEELPGYCDKCARLKGCPDEWEDLAEKVDAIIRYMKDDALQRIAKELGYIAEGLRKAH